MYSIRRALVGRIAAAALALLTIADLGHAQMHVATTRISVSSTGTQANGSYPSVSADGRYVAFESSSPNLVGGDTNGQSDVFVRDRELSTTTRASLSFSGVQGNGWSYQSAISANGRHVAFVSNATNLVTGDTNSKYDVFVRDLETGITTRASVSSAGIQANGESFDGRPAISADGRYVAFRSAASNLVTGDTNGATDVFVRDMVAGTTIRVSVSSEGAQGNGETGDSPSISADGRYVSFTSQAVLTTGDTNGATDIFVRDLEAGTTTRASVSTAGAQGNQHSHHSTISADGKFVAFASSASNLVVGDTNSCGDVFLRDLVGGTTSRISVSSGNVQGDRVSTIPSISDSGRYVAFESSATNFSLGDTNNAPDIFLRDQQTGSTLRLSESTVGVLGNGYSNLASISGDGRFVAYHSEASNLVPDDTNSTKDVFMAQWVVEPKVSGQVTFSDFVGTLPGTALLEFRDPANGSIVRSVDAAIAADGSFSAYSPGPGFWDLSARIGHWLRRTVRVDATGGDVSGVLIQLPNGDIDGDNAITVFDYNLLSEAFDSVEGEANWNADTDLDGDGAVTVFDYNILSQNFDMVGD